MAAPASLTADEQEIARLMVEGLDRDATILGEPVPAHWPLTITQAAKAVGYKTKRARNHLGDLHEFNQLRGKLLKERRESEGARNLATLIKIRDDEGDGLAADRTVQLKAVSAIEGNEGKAALTVNVNQQTNIAAISPGYVIKLPAPRSPAIGRSAQAPLTIEHNDERADAAPAD